MSGYQVRTLRTFVTVVETGSFSSAARALSISQPAVTMQIQSLESELGVTLLERRFRRVELTEAGRVLLPVAERVIRELEAVREDIAALEGQVTGHLVIAASTTPGVYVIPRFLGGFLAENPRVEVTLLVADSSDVAAKVAEGEAGLGFTGAEVKAAHVCFCQIGTDELVVIAPLSSRLAGSHVSAQALADQPFVIREQGSGTRQAREAVFHKLGIDSERLRVALELGSGEAVVTAVEGGLGIAVVSRLVAARALELGSVLELDVDGFPAARPLYSVTPRGGASNAAQAFLDYLRKKLPTTGDLPIDLSGECP